MPHTHTCHIHACPAYTQTLIHNTDTRMHIHNIRPNTHRGMHGGQAGHKPGAGLGLTWIGHAGGTEVAGGVRNQKSRGNEEVKIRGCMLINPG